MKKLKPFNYKAGSATKKGKPVTVRGITPDHSVYYLIFNETGSRRNAVTVKRLQKIASVYPTFPAILAHAKGNALMAIRILKTAKKVNEKYQSSINNHQLNEVPK